MKLSTSNTNANIAIYTPIVVSNTIAVNSSSITIGTNTIVNSTAISVGSVSINSTVISTPSLFVGGTSLPLSGITSGIVNAQFFTANGTWTKPAGLTGNEQVLIMMWGGGGWSGSLPLRRRGCRRRAGSGWTRRR